MTERADLQLIQALQAVSNALAKLPARWMIIGGIAVVIRGVPRQTQDIDATVWAPDTDLESVVQVMQSSAIEPRIADAVEFARQNQVLLLRHSPSATPVDLSFAWLPFEEESLKRATEERFDHATVRVATAEDLIVFKAVAWRDRDKSDIERLLVLHGPTVNLTRVRKLVSEFAEVLDDTERVAQFDQLVARTATLGSDH